METIKVQSLSKKFNGNPAVQGLTFSVEEGELFGLVGPDGAGKTTTLRMLASILDPTSGDAWVGGFHVTEEAERIKEIIGYMGQRFDLYPDLTVMENITFYADIYEVPRRERKQKIERLLAFSNLGPFTKRLAGNLSGGMKQKLGLACSLVHTPKVLFLDEPTNGVDPVSRRDFWRILYQLRKEGVTILVSTAYLDEAERCNRLVLMHQGQSVASGSPDELKRLVQGDFVEIRAPQPRVAAQVLRRDGGMGMVELFGERIHLLADDFESAATHARTVLDKHGIATDEIFRVEPSLEDVFVTILAGKRVSDR
ncbi:MAG: ABC transporter ATP-binding protein [Candidatus Abyssobacteria bacterium SURF_5]|uniref:ABC transporter ATP-binding protein n=1 Tax=Abyssobacteria bacterium (strain SURF_5) TaxID=2093360 RepID=A0A3A4NWR6_ABYX5|nr:MAG: ABC transporter ATP-binding protein [Candidatus Abyssubacteria bacterium SURF_5]